ncbi:hypothetical protein EZ449_12790 [Pedobacter frigidisoli]|uniref:Uncharacterized protein n=2 Tax=Pedobacter frigidisoli TaxID=2530455 RepID=A0A4V2MMS5_9SPHI|nr:hypothetical protein EZ449_12790 [Pedobacter frigidisoli]
MENYTISLRIEESERHFEIGEYMHHDGERCRFKVFENKSLVASFDPDKHQILQVCTNPAKLDMEILDLLAEAIEEHHPHGPTRQNSLEHDDAETQ